VPKKCLSEFGSRVYSVFIMLRYMYGFIQTVVKIVKRGDIDVLSMVVKWAIHWVISSLCGVPKRLFLVEGDVCVLKLGWAVSLCPEPLFFIQFVVPIVTNC